MRRGGVMWRGGGGGGWRGGGGGEGGGGGGVIYGMRGDLLCWYEEWCDI